MPPIHFPLRRAADSLSRVRSLIISRSNCANDSRMFSVGRPIDVLVLKSCVTDETHATGTSQAFAQVSRLRPHGKSQREMSCGKRHPVVVTVCVSYSHHVRS